MFQLPCNYLNKPTTKSGFAKSTCLTSKIWALHERPDQDLAQRRWYFPICNIQCTWKSKSIINPFPLRLSCMIDLHHIQQSDYYKVRKIKEHKNIRFYLYGHIRYYKVALFLVLNRSFDISAGAFHSVRFPHLQHVNNSAMIQRLQVRLSHALSMLKQLFKRKIHSSYSNATSVILKTTSQQYNIKALYNEKLAI
ncbi:hypothetical protein CDL12_10008 [Handroanthus impetiginosus]|uniref:Uncharacterized protein n=1 Tax=Handroanthus impetiginosus TaxID=429701 RepID=A0A2G9HIK0_9LAMI|nr:hypothetical protein CDL12_10008 [Handroanthus impetiginosus]